MNAHKNSPNGKVFQKFLSALAAYGTTKDKCIQKSASQTIAFHISINFLMSGVNNPQIPTFIHIITSYLKPGLHI